MDGCVSDIDSALILRNPKLSPGNPFKGELEIASEEVQQEIKSNQRIAGSKHFRFFSSDLLSCWLQNLPIYSRLNRTTKSSVSIFSLEASFQIQVWDWLSVLAQERLPFAPLALHQVSAAPESASCCLCLWSFSKSTMHAHVLSPAWPSNPIHFGSQMTWRRKRAQMILATSLSSGGRCLIWRQ